MSDEILEAIRRRVAAALAWAGNGMASIADFDCKELLDEVDRLRAEASN